jgi:tRNA(fMet)-specific endonuclease VapC
VSILLDTNAYASFRRGHRGVVARVRHASQILLSAIVVGELSAGFEIGGRRDENYAELERFMDRPAVRFLPVSRTTTRRYAQVMARLRQQGRPIPTNDMWIAAHALETGAELVSFDEHFGLVDGVAWIKPGEH